LAFRQLRLLLVNRGLNELRAWQRRLTRKVYQGRCLDDQLKIDIDWVGNVFCIRSHNDHLARAEDYRLTKGSVPRQTQASFQNEYLDITTWNILHHDRCPGDRRSDSSGVNLCAAQSLRDLQEHRPLLQRQVARSRLKTEKCLRPDSR